MSVQDTEQALVPEADQSVVDAPEEAPHQNLDDTTSEPVNETASEDKAVEEVAKPIGTVKKADVSKTPVKTVLKSGTFGIGTTKSTPTKPVAPAPRAGAVPTLKKPVASPTAASKAPTTATTKSSVTPSATTTAAKRTSLAPTKSAVPAARSSLAPSAAKAASTITKPTTTTTRAPLASSASSKLTSAASARASIASPTGAKPRLSTAPVTKPAAAPTLKKAAPTVSAATRPAVRPGSISSLKEVKPDPKVVSELQSKLDEATTNLTAKSEELDALVAQLESSKDALTVAQASLESKESAHTDLQASESAAKTKIDELVAALEEAKSASADSASLVEQVKAELEGSKVQLDKALKDSDGLLAKVTSLEQEVSTHQSARSDLEKTHADSFQAATEAARVEHEALLKAKADLEAIQKESEALVAAHASSASEAEQKIKDLSTKAASAEKLETELSTAKKEATDVSNRLSETEIELLELKESFEQAKEANAKITSEVKQWQDEISKIKGDLDATIAANQAQRVEHDKLLDSLKSSHSAALKDAASAHEKTTGELSTLQETLKKANASHEQAKAAHSKVVEEQAAALNDLAQDHQKKFVELSEELEKVKVDRDSQEAQYNAKVETVKNEHAKLLAEAFEKAKLEAGTAHGSELQELRAKSKASIDELIAAHQTTLAGLKAEHGSTSEAHERELKKQANQSSLDLKAAKDDLSKTKASLEGSKAEIESLTSQLASLKASIPTEPIPSPEQEAAIKKLTAQNASYQDDIKTLNEQLAFNKQTLQGMADNHSKELEEAAKGRAGEVTKLTAAHNDEKGALTSSVSELKVKLSDLEGELATLKATAAVAPTPTSPIANGRSLSPSSSGAGDLQKLHEAHNLKLQDLQLEHEKAIAAAHDTIEKSLVKVDELEQEVARKAMQIKFLEDSQDEEKDEVARLTEELEELKKSKA